MSEVSPILEKQISKTVLKIKSLFDDMVDECEKAALIYEMSPEAADDLMQLIATELESFHDKFYDIIISKCINQMRINYSQGKLFDD
jgi:hypothetical protein